MSFVKGHRVGISHWPVTAHRDHPLPPTYPPTEPKHAMYTPPSITPTEARTNGQVPIISCGRHGSLNIAGTSTWTANPSDTAITAMIAASKKVVRMSLQDLGPLAVPGPFGPQAIPNGVWPKAYLRELGTAIFQRGVRVEIVVSGPNCVPGRCIFLAGA